MTFGNIKYPSCRITETIFVDKNSDDECVHEFDTTHTNNIQEKTVMFTRRNMNFSDGEIFEFKQPRTEPLHAQLLVPDIKLAFQSYLQDLEVHGADEDTVIRELFKYEDLRSTYDEIVTESRKSRGEYLIRSSKNIAGKMSQLVTHLQKGSWKNTNPDEEYIKACSDHVDNGMINTNACYRTAYLSTEALREAGYTAEYCEGIALPKYGGVPQTHAWVEVNGNVIELTWPWSGPKPDEMGVYYGHKIDWETTKEKMMERPTFASVMMDDNMYYAQSDVQKAMKHMSGKNI